MCAPTAALLAETASERWSRRSVCVMHASPVCIQFAQHHVAAYCGMHDST